MGNQVPQLPVGSAPITVWYNRVSNAIPSNRVACCTDYNIKQSSRGTILSFTGNDTERIFVDDCGEYNANKSYGSGDLVSVYPDVIYTSSVDIVVSASVGTWICECAIPDREISDIYIANSELSSSFPYYLRKPDIKYYPIYPQPSVKASETDNGDGRFWRLIGLLSGSNTIGSSAQRMRVNNVYGDYLLCKTYDGTNEGTDILKVAKPVELRHSLSSQVIAGNTVSYTYSPDANIWDGARTASCGTVKQIEIVIPVYQTGTNSDCEIWADSPIGGTGAQSASVDLTWLDTNRAARAWCMIGSIL